MEPIKAFVVTRNMTYTLKNTVEFLKKEPRVEITIIDNDSTYEPTLNYYNEIPDINIHCVCHNGGPYVLWHAVPHLKNDNFFIVTDSDCTYDNVPADWLDKMLHALNNSNYYKVGFSLEIDDIPDTKVGTEAKNWERQFWSNPDHELNGLRANIDTTFALYRPKSGFDYGPSLRLNRPYVIRHEPWYLDENNITEDWKYYYKNATTSSYWGNRLKAHEVVKID